MRTCIDGGGEALAKSVRMPSDFLGAGFKKHHIQVSRAVFSQMVGRR